MKKARDPNLAALLQERGAATRIAKACGVSHTAVSQWVSVPTRHLRVVADTLGVTVDQLVPPIQDAG